MDWPARAKRTLVLENVELVIEGGSVSQEKLDILMNSIGSIIRRDIPILFPEDRPKEGCGGCGK